MVLKEKPRIYVKTLRQCGNMFFAQAAFTRQYSGYHGLRTDLREVRGAELVLCHEQAQHGQVGRFFQSVLLKGGQLFITVS